MKVAVEFFPAEQQKTSMSDPLPIATWKLDPIPQFPYKAQIKERHTTGRNVATGLQLYKQHNREVWIISERSGYVQPCADNDCWDQRRFGSALYGTKSRLERKGWRLTMIEVIS